MVNKYNISDKRLALLLRQPHKNYDKLLTIRECRELTEKILFEIFLANYVYYEFNLLVGTVNNEFALKINGIDDFYVELNFTTELECYANGILIASLLSVIPFKLELFYNSLLVSFIESNTPLDTLRF